VSPITDRDIPLSVNGEVRVAPRDCSIRALLAALALEGRRVAVAVNRDVVPRSSFASHRLRAGDRVEILEAVGGG
jgi:sulfur carrier protein